MDSTQELTHRELEVLRLEQELAQAIRLLVWLEISHEEPGENLLWFRKLAWRARLTIAQEEKAYASTKRIMSK